MLCWEACICVLGLSSTLLLIYYVLYGEELCRTLNSVLTLIAIPVFFLPLFTDNVYTEYTVSIMQLKDSNYSFDAIKTKDGDIINLNRYFGQRFNVGDKVYSKKYANIGCFYFSDSGNNLVVDSPH